MTDKTDLPTSTVCRSPWTPDMETSDERIEEFIRLWAEAFKERLSVTTAAIRAKQLAMLYRELLESPCSECASGAVAKTFPSTRSASQPLW